MFLYKHIEAIEKKIIKSSLPFLKIPTSQVNNKREFFRLRIENFQGIVFIWTRRTYTECFKSALV